MHQRAQGQSSLCGFGSWVIAGLIARKLPNQLLNRTAQKRAAG